jgi:hypothetical protein
MGDEKDTRSWRDGEEEKEERPKLERPGPSPWE